MYFLGIDPDLSTPAWAVVKNDGTVDSVGVWRLDHKKRIKQTGQDKVLECAEYLANQVALLSGVADVVLCVENQDITYTARQGANPKDLLPLSMMTGLIIGAYLSDSDADSTIYSPMPRDWKGQVPKQIHQARTYSKLGWEYEQLKTYSHPVAITYSVRGADNLNRGDWRHVGDAIGLALWAREKFYKENK